MQQSPKNMPEDSKLILAAGMARSGSTWLYNAIRLLVMCASTRKQIFEFGWFQDFNEIASQNDRLIKLHSFNGEFVANSDCILYSYRDVRDTLASSFRKYGLVPSIQTVDSQIENHSKWIAVADYTVRYETMLQSKEKIVSEIALKLELKHCNPEDIVNSIENLAYEDDGDKNGVYNKINLLHRGHMTNGRHGTWNGVLDRSLLDEINEKYSWWLIENDYPLSI